MSTIWLRALPYIVALLLVSGALFGAYHHGETVTNDEWQAKWSERDARDEAAQALNEVAERTKEQARQQSINKAIEDGQKIIDQAVADATAARADVGMRDAADRVSSRVAASQTSSHSCTAATSEAATRAVMVLADVLKRADQRAGDLAADADQARFRGLTCEQAYISLGR